MLGAPISAHVRTKRLNNCEYPGRAGPVSHACLLKVPYCSGLSEEAEKCLCEPRGARACRAPFLREKHNSTRSPEEMARAVLFATGPWLLRDAFRAVTGEAGRLAGGYAGAHTVRGTRYMVYELGQWCDTSPPPSRARRTRGSCGRAQAVRVACNGRVRPWC